MPGQIPRGFSLLFSCLLLEPVFSVHSQMCELILEIDKERKMCEAQIENRTTGCSGIWDNITCWPGADIGEVVTMPCPQYLLYLFGDVPSRNLSKTCTVDGWTPISRDSYITDCGYNPNNTVDENAGKFFSAIKVGYTIGHSVSIISLTIAIIILCLFRKLHCTRNYIHMHLFVSLILKAVSVFIKDVILYDVGETENCQPSVGCKAVVAFFHYGVMASYFWLLVEGLYLHALLAVSFFSERKYFWWYILIGWGAPTIFICAWVITKAYSNEPGCWEMNDDNFWLIIKIPILVTLLVSFCLFICIIRILRQKMNCPDIGRKESNQYSYVFSVKSRQLYCNGLILSSKPCCSKCSLVSCFCGLPSTPHFTVVFRRLAKSTLLLIPLFGINYILFSFLPDHIHTQVRMVFDLVLGSFQGFVVAVLYCFLNGEVQSEIRRKWRRWMLQRFLGAGTKYQHPSTGSCGNNFSTQISMLPKCSPTARRASESQEHSSII
ncbi:vasoactive intestinal polypeptide receptor-like isoform X1 [Cololabis saira]|uniref:vasoactive intestinal polypeptide receptor-like isoform X1 n=1 Tax=Cololabis saira TaxID=129043 RepID=UPI002AD3D9D8|nr:vasoactive intestinal polypeptide receptor-like isoform X1 [Cololabis saira]